MYANGRRLTLSSRGSAKSWLGGYQLGTNSNGRPVFSFAFFVTEKWKFFFGSLLAGQVIISGELCLLVWHSPSARRQTAELSLRSRVRFLGRAKWGVRKFSVAATVMEIIVRKPTLQRYVLENIQNHVRRFKFCHLVQLPTTRYVTNSKIILVTLCYPTVLMVFL